MGVLLLPEMLVLTVITSLLPLLVLSQCQVEPSPDNVVSTQLEGSWIPDDNINSWLAPILSADIDTKELKFYRNESVSLPQIVCDSYTVYMEGQITNVYGLNDVESVAFILTEIHGNPHIILYYQEYDDLESFNVMLARAENSRDDILFT